MRYSSKYNFVFLSFAILVVFSFFYANSANAQTIQTTSQIEQYNEIFTKLQTTLYTLEGKLIALNEQIKNGEFENDKDKTDEINQSLTNARNILISINYNLESIKNEIAQNGNNPLGNIETKPTENIQEDITASQNETENELNAEKGLASVYETGGIKYAMITILAFLAISISFFFVFRRENKTAIATERIEEQNETQTQTTTQ